MDLNGPGISLFQGNDIHNFDNLAQREEEEEAIEEQKQRDLELRNILENAFDDVSFDNEEGSVCNGSQNHLSGSASNIQNNFNNVDLLGSAFKEAGHNRLLSSFERNGPNNLTDTFNSSLTKLSKFNQAKRKDLINDNDLYSDQARKKILNGSIHDVVDASGGGDVPLSHYNHCCQRNSSGEIIFNGNSHDSSNKEAEDSIEQLKVLYDVRVREVHRLTELVDSLKNEHEIAIKTLKQQLSLSQAELERANISQAQLQSLLVSCKQEIQELKNCVSILEKDKEDLEAQKNEIISNFETAKLSINDLERKILVLEKGSQNNCEAMQYEKNIKGLIEKHNFELMNVNLELDKNIKINNELAKENSDLKLKLSDLGRINDENLAKKSEIISRLSKQIDETQKQCESLMKSSINEDNIRLQMELKLLKEEKQNFITKLEALEKENSRQEEELKHYESISKISFNDSFSHSKEIDGSEVSGKLGAELYRALNGQKAKRQEIKNLQAQLSEKNERLNELRDSELILKSENNKFKEDAMKHLIEKKNLEKVISEKEEEIVKLKNAITNIKQDMAKADNTFHSKILDKEKEIESLQNRLENVEKTKAETQTSEKISEEYLRFHNEGLERVREETEYCYKLEILKKDLEIENLKKEVEEIKNLYVEVYNSKEALLAQMEKEINSSGRSSAVDVEEVKRLQKELQKSRQRILELDQTLKQQYQQEVEILNLDINQLNLQLEKMKKEKDREIADKDRISVENELLKSEIEQVTSGKNLLFLNCEKLRKQLEETLENNLKERESFKSELRQLKEKHEGELQSLSSKYEVIIKKLKQEVEITLAKPVKYETKFTSPLKNLSRSIESQSSPVSVDSKSTSPLRKEFTRDFGTSPMSLSKRDSAKAISKDSPPVRDVGVVTDPQASTISKKEVVGIMEKLGTHHENELKAMENHYLGELKKLDKKFQMEMDGIKEIIREELYSEHLKEVEELKERHKIELENRIQQEKKEAVADLITDWACEVQSLKNSYAEAQTEIERMKMKYKAAKSIALQYKSYFKNKTEDMKVEWKRIESGYEQALKELEKNVHVLVDVKEDEVKAKVECITKIYEQKISKMKEKLTKCEDRLKAKKDGRKRSPEEKFSFGEKLDVPDGILCSRGGSGSGAGLGLGGTSFSRKEKVAKGESRKKKDLEDLFSDRERTSR